MLSRTLIFSLSLFALVPSLQAAAGDVAVSVTVDTDKPGLAIPGDYSGLSFETSLLIPDQQGTRYFRPDNQTLIRLFKTLGVKNLRVGGNTGDRDARKLPAEADIDSLFAFARVAGVKVIYCLRLCHGDPLEAAKTAKYIMDRYADRLECFSIGQEPSAYPVEKVDTRAPDQRMGAAAEKYPYATFGAEWSRFADKILAMVPNAKFCGPGVHKNPDWLRRFMTGSGHQRNVFMVTTHLYPGGPGGKVTSPESGRERMLSGEFDAVYKSLHDGFVPFAMAKNLPYRIEEANNFYNGGAADVSTTFASSLWGLDFLWWWAAHNAAGINFHTGNNVAAGSTLTKCKYTAFYTTPEGCTVQPLGYAIKAFELGGKGRIVPVSVSAQASLRLAVYGTVLPDKTVLVTCINKQYGTGSCDLDMTLSAGATAGSGQIISLLAPNGDISATSGVTLGDGQILADGTWNGGWKPVARGAAGKFLFKLPPASAVVVKVTPLPSIAD